MAQRTIEQEYAQARPKSKALYERAVRLMPSGAAHDGRVFSPFPFYVDRADGAYKWDVDGHRYIDGWSGHGAVILGHNHPAIVAAIREQAGKGTHYSAGSELELRWAELIHTIVPGAERVRFTMTGTETTALALRVARAATGRTKIVKFRGHFHGLHDSVMAAVKDPFELPASAGVPEETVAQTLVARCNDIAHVKELLDEHEVAAVILEPAASRSMTVPTDPAPAASCSSSTKSSRASGWHRGVRRNTSASPPISRVWPRRWRAGFRVLRSPGAQTCSTAWRSPVTLGAIAPGA
jgi:glutamate-1-semialdehyde 2,1-aminomutase